MTAAEQMAVDEFNDRFPIGTPVEYWPGVREGDGRRSRTRSKARVLSGHTAVVWVDGQGGCIALTHVEPDVDTTCPTCGSNGCPDCRGDDEEATR